jgi:PAS domain S-box-containing protein
VERPAIDPAAQLWARPDFQSLAFGRRGEVLAAKIRLGVTALVALIPLESALRRSPGAEAWIGLGAALSVLAVGSLVLRLAQRTKPPALLSLFTSLLDVSTVSLINAGFVLSGNPLAATNSRVVFSCYFVALGMVCLRQDPRWCLVAALAAMAEYGVVVLWAVVGYDLRGPAFALSGYGKFNWDNQVGRLILLAVTGAIGAVIVAQSRRYWQAVIVYLDSFPLGVLIAGADGRSQFANRAAQNLLGRPLPAGTDVLELNAQSFLADTDQPYPPERSTIGRALAGEPSESDDLEIQRPGSRIAVSAWGTPILDARGRVARAIAVFHDQTRRRRAEAELIHQRQYLESLHETTLEIMNRLELDDLLQSLVTRASELLQTSNGFLYLENADGSALDCRVWVGSKPRDPVAAPNEGAVGHVWQAGAPLVVADYDTWPGRSPQVPRGVFGPMAAAPLRMGGRVAGALGVAHAAGSQRSFGAAEEQLLSGFARLASLALDNARLYASAQQSEERYRRLVQDSLGLLCTHDLDGVLLVVNAAAAQALGYEADEMVGHNLRDFLLPSVRWLFEQYIARVRRDGVAEGVMRIAARDGQERLWRYRNILRQEAGRPAYIIGFALDETDRVRAQEALRQSEERFRQLAENIDAVFWMRSLEPAEVLYVSPAYERIVGRPPEELYRNPWSLIESVHPEDRDRVRAVLTRQAPEFDEEYRIIRPGGAIRWVRSRAFPIPDEDQRVNRVAGITEDVTALKQAEELREDLTHTMVHDLRGPLTWVLGSLGLLETTLETGPSLENRALVSKARNGAQRILHLVDSILEVARLEQGELPLQPQPVEIRAIVSEAIGLAAALAEEKRLALIQETPHDTPAAWADPQIIGRVVQNLLGNAIKFTPEGGRIRVNAGHDSSSVRISVSDSGPGIADDVRPRLFQKFATSRQRPHGSGLGLAFCRLAVEAHGGKIWAETAPDGGAQLVFTLPVAP